MQTMICARRYPKILAHALLVHHNIEVPREVVDASHRQEVEGKEVLEHWICNGGLGRLSFAILAVQDCKEDVDEMRRDERQKIMDEERETSQ